ncbi:VOC family protein [Streptomyces sp. HB2AG]|uniref:VOC family protein n=1 Tax=Streptomyces sp. HB2AG TaxID=2983400 RepID=UPI0022AA52C8|nr:VOC family protein [Streptomyces sp. HB2AG]MCZ2526598.1 VOC family protein [Streptomyces sp. HB2AG]
MIAKMQVMVIDCPDPAALGRFYQQILGWELKELDESWVTLAGGDGTTPLAFQKAPDHVPPQWPDSAHPQQMHLDLEVDTREDVEQAQEQVLALGAVFLHDSGGEKRGFRVFADPAGHPFCLCYGQG